MKRIALLLLFVMLILPTPLSGADAKIRAVGWTASAQFRGYAASHSGIGFVCLRAGRL